MYAYHLIVVKDKDKADRILLEVHEALKNLYC